MAKNFFKIHPRTKVLRKVDSVSCEILKGTFGRFPIPTELVVSEPQLAIPYYAKYWSLSKWIYQGKEVNYEELRKIPDFHGTAYFPSVFLVEHWENCGSDGHVEFSFKSWYEISSDEKLDYKKVNEAIQDFENEQK